ncbi:MAG: LPS assembly lipoprotein LptE [Devosia sp.]
MSWSEPLRRIAVACLMLGLVTALGACSFSPVYSGTLASQPMLNLAFAKPTSRLEQVIYQELALRFGSSDTATAPLATVTASSSAATVALSVTSNPNKLARLTVTATLTLTRRDGTGIEPISFTRVASADYTTSGQVLADTAAATEAAERAAKAAAESLRLAMLASLSRG